jgi:hypothetical protein
MLNSIAADFRPGRRTPTRALPGLADERTSKRDGHHGLGLSIVRPIAAAHEAKITARHGAEAGLDINVSFPSDGSNHASDHQATTATPALTST